MASLGELSWSECCYCGKVAKPADNVHSVECLGEKVIDAVNENSTLKIAGREAASSRVKPEMQTDCGGACDGAVSAAGNCGHPCQQPRKFKAGGPPESVTVQRDWSDLQQLLSALGQYRQRVEQERHVAPPKYEAVAVGSAHTSQTSLAVREPDQGDKQLLLESLRPIMERQLQQFVHEAAACSKALAAQQGSPVADTEAFSGNASSPESPTFSPPSAACRRASTPMQRGGFVDSISVADAHGDGAVAAAQAAATAANRAAEAAAEASRSIAQSARWSSTTDETGGSLVRPEALLLHCGRRGVSELRDTALRPTQLDPPRGENAWLGGGTQRRQLNAEGKRRDKRVLEPSSKSFSFPAAPTASSTQVRPTLPGRTAAVDLLVRGRYPGNRSVGLAKNLRRVEPKAESVLPCHRPERCPDAALALATGD
ncbi:conserved hypothetical protein [Neospora caninum Liverpool]|uniref:Uncharacterized protein n=1 Tax=Neospora caninum (strain Liverpool) TaxID=572307 RepID=F0VBZ9_NEOCL|nr:conserved hypothetical protein [Neospora caninum Liverpool]CBZ51133.1 conserved hypothetical protein [Neospora caninum Liverpool]|eukprot:XP_003881166.1 conserved hypothetical protein [Neospora caninum Liverpool]